MRCWMASGRVFRLPTHPDVAAFHEGFADLVAMLMHFSYSDVVRAAIERSGAMLETDALLLSLASQFGHTTGSEGPLRSAINPAGLGQHKEGSIRRYDEVGDEPHERGSVLVTAIVRSIRDGTAAEDEAIPSPGTSGSAASSGPRNSPGTLAIRQAHWHRNSFRSAYVPSTTARRSTCVLANICEL